ncbi:MAG: hypothetical protein AABZ58_13755 [Chloroflexota bacterium]
MLGQGITQLQKALNAKGDVIQREFITISDRLNVVARGILETKDEERAAFVAEQDELHEKRAALAEEVNVWRDRAKMVTNRPGEDALRDYLKELVEAMAGEEAIQAAIKHVQFLLDATEEELATLAQTQQEEKPLTPAGRMLDRGRKEWDLRQEDPALRQRAAAEFANRQGMAQDMEAIAEIEDAIFDPDKFVREVAVLTMIQLHRFRAMRLADLGAAYQSVEKLVHINHPSAVAALITILENPRSGFVHKAGENEPVEETNSRLRVAALKRLIEWHTPEARNAIQSYQLDRDSQVSYLARRALETFPGEWKGPIRGAGILKQ